MKDIVIVDGARTPMAEYNGHFSDISAIDLAVIAAKETLSRSGYAAEEVDHVIVGNALQTSGDAIYGARHVGLKAGVPKHVPALTVWSWPVGWRTCRRRLSSCAVLARDCASARRRWKTP